MARHPPNQRKWCGVQAGPPEITKAYRRQLAIQQAAAIKSRGRAWYRRPPTRLPDATTGCTGQATGAGRRNGSSLPKARGAILRHAERRRYRQGSVFELHIQAELSR